MKRNLFLLIVSVAFYEGCTTTNNISSRYESQINYYFENYTKQNFGNILDVTSDDFIKLFVKKLNELLILDTNSILYTYIVGNIRRDEYKNLKPKELYLSYLKNTIINDTFKKDIKNLLITETEKYVFVIFFDKDNITESESRFNLDVFEKKSEKLKFYDKDALEILDSLISSAKKMNEN